MASTDTTAPSAGLHHITAICGDPAANARFYTRELGLRLVKRTVNFDDPGTYHLYYGDETGTPGSALTFFPFRGVPRGRHGVGSAVEIGFAVPKLSIAYWMERLSARNIPHDKLADRFGESVIRFADPDGLAIEIVGTDWAGVLPGWTNAEAGADQVPAEHAVRGFAGVSLWVRQADATARVLTEAFGYETVGEEAGLIRYRAGGADGLGPVVDVKVMSDAAAERQGTGTIHHIAFRADDDAHEMALRRKVLALGLQPTPQIDRTYFHSVYFREPSGILFEIATDAPGFTLDEDEASLGQALKLPPQYEAHRAEIEAALPVLN